MLNFARNAKLFFIGAQLLFGPLALNDAAQLHRNRGNQFHQPFVLLARLQHVKLDHGHNFLIGQHRDAHTGFDTDLAGNRQPRKIAGVRDVADPGRLFGGPDSTRQALTGFELLFLTYRAELSGTLDAAKPGWTALQKGVVAARQPCLAERPTGGFAHCAEHDRQSRVKVLRFVHREGNALEQAALFFRAFPLRDVADERDQQPGSLQLDIIESDFYEDFRVILFQPGRFGGLLPGFAGVGTPKTLGPFAVLIPGALRQQHLEALSDQVVWVPAKNLLRRRVGKLNDTLGVHQYHGVCRVLPEEAVALFAFAQRFFGAAARCANSRLAKLARDRGRQAREIAFHQVIIRAGLHRRHCDVFADASGNNEKRQIESAVLNDLERLRRAERGHVVVGENDVPCFVCQCGAQRFGGFNPLKRRLIATLLERADQDAGIELRVFDDQHPERYFLLGRAHKRRR